MSEEDLTNYKKYISDLDITKYVVLDNGSNYWYSAEHVDKMLKKQDKEIERLKEENKKYKKWIESLNKDNHRLNNIIKEVREHIEKTIEYEKGCGFNRWTYEDGQETYIDMVEKTLDILDKENK